ncbi:hypothetical protein AMAG_10995 [Allomyces macrogynus ATCC 38327]|uniref:Uncharacterized protein n=1 Tax=Allomyces macrogynus (strain ATCC 38327) TaxID=578462 RepID=A0A0L0SS29_ALLM3|nr:hypothetical protein AMAG_10995 [Allomyces macrogynus ATCC 38327]|eukprot:KNE65353.1 hypothetical protein AMAG_10995 [Allomyces macrogynus ATCC 38327]
MLGKKGLALVAYSDDDEDGTSDVEMATADPPATTTTRPPNAPASATLSTATPSDQHARAAQTAAGPAPRSSALDPDGHASSTSSPPLGPALGPQLPPPGAQIDGDGDVPMLDAPADVLPRLPVETWCIPVVTDLTDTYATYSDFIAAYLDAAPVAPGTSGAPSPPVSAPLWVPAAADDAGAPPLSCSLFPPIVTPCDRTAVPVDPGLHATLAEWAKHKVRGVHFNDVLLASPEFATPDLFRRMVAFLDLDESGSNLDQGEVPPVPMAEVLAKRQDDWAARAHRRQEAGARTQIQFVQSSSSSALRSARK